jgi:signal transduction histidine kinase
LASPRTTDDARGGRTFLQSRVARRVFWTFALCAVVPLLLFSFYALHRARGELEQDARERLRTSSKLSALATWERLSLLDAELELVARTHGPAAGAEAAHALVFSSDRFDSLAWHLPDGEVRRVIGSPAPLPEIDGPARRRLAAGRTLVAVRMDAAALPAVLLIRPAAGGGSSPPLLVAQLDPEYLWPHADAEEATKLLVLDRTGRALRSTNDGSGAAEALREALAQIERDGQFAWSSPDERFVGGFFELFLGERFGAPAWTIAHFEPESVVLAPLVRFEIAFVLFAALALVTALLLALVQVRRTLGPIDTLRAATERIAAHDLAARVEIDTRDEFAELGAAFNQMTESLARHEADLRASQQQLLQAQKMEAIGRLAGGVAHDFNNLLTAIRGYSALAVERLPARDPLRDDLEQIQGAADRATDLTRQLLAFSRKQELKLAPLDPNAVVLDFEKLLRRVLGGNVRLELRLGTGVGVIEADRGQLEQVLMNLVVNARDALPEGGRIEVATERVALAGAGPLGEVVLRVRDDGTGMDDATLSRIFDPFFTTKPEGVGTGLGLATVYGIVERAGGRIDVASRLGQGTCFSLHFPCVAEALLGAKAAESPATAASGSETVLVVDDEPSILRLASRILRRAGYAVLEAGTGSDAEALVNAHAHPIHLLVTDVQMPGLPGPELARRMRDRHSGVRVLFVSGAAEAGAHSLAAHEGVLAKPFTADELTRAARDLLDRA